jgi:transcriptional regulator with XRE-family HTH domain
MIASENLNSERTFVVYLGQKLRKLRKEQNLTQLDLARQVDITNGQISTIERGVSSPSIATLHRISNVIGVPMSEFFADAPAGQVRSSAVRAPDRRHRRAHQGGRVGGPGPDRRLQRLFVEVNPGGTLHMRARPSASEACFLYAVAGKCTLQIEDESYALEPGDSVHINARREQTIKNAGTGSFQALIVSQQAQIGSEVQTVVTADQD